MEICTEFFIICDRNKNNVLDKREYQRVTQNVYSLFLPNERKLWEWREMDKDKDGKISLSEWLSGTEAIAVFVGEEAFLKALFRWARKENSKNLQRMIKAEQARKTAEREPFEAPAPAKSKPPFSPANRKSA